MDIKEESYNALLNRLYGLQRAGIKYTLENIQRLLDYIDNPQQQWPAIHLAGTNGKGSTANILASILRKARNTLKKIGLKVCNPYTIRGINPFCSIRIFSRF